MEKDKKKMDKKIILIIVVLLFSAIILLGKINEIKISDFINLFKTGEKTLLLTNSLDNDNIKDIKIYKNNIAIWKGNKLSIMKKDGEIILEEELNFLEPAIYFGEKYIYSFDKSTGEIHFLKTNGENIHKLSLDKELFNIKEIEGHLMCHSINRNIERIEILDKDWVLIGNPTFEGKNILSYDIDKKGSNIIVSVLNLDEETLKSEIYSYGENNEKLGSLKIEEEIILFNKIIKANSEVVLTDKTLYYIEDKDIVWEKSFSLIKDIYIRKDMIYLLHGNYLKVIDFQGRIKSEIGFTENYRKIIDFDGSTLVYGDENLAIVKNGKLVTEVEESILKAYTNSKDIILLGPDALSIYKLTNKE